MFSGASALHLAIAYHNNDLVAILINCCADVSQRAIGQCGADVSQRLRARAESVSDVLTSDNGNRAVPAEVQSADEVVS